MTKLVCCGVAALLAGCASGSRATAVSAAQAARCNDLACLEANEGNVVDVEGTFSFPRDPRRKGQHVYRLALADGTSLVLHAPPAGELRAKLSRDNDGKHAIVRGRIYTKTIPAHYGIIQRTADPYCVELFDVTITP